MKIYFASDAHLGARFHKDPLAIEKKLVRWLDSIKYVFWGNWPS